MPVNATASTYVFILTWQGEEGRRFGLLFPWFIDHHLPDIYQNQLLSDDQQLPKIFLYYRRFCRATWRKTMPDYLQSRLVVMEIFGILSENVDLVFLESESYRSVLVKWSIFWFKCIRGIKNKKNPNADFEKTNFHQLSII